MTNSRDDFPIKIKEILKQRAAYICSNPSCKKMTIAPSVADLDAVQFIGVCAHITAACDGGPRYKKEMNSVERSSIQNGIFLCSNCAALIDKNDGKDYDFETLIRWKEDHESWVIQNLNKPYFDGGGLTSNNQTGGITANTVHVNNYPQQVKGEVNLANEHDKNLFLKAEAILGEDQLLQMLSTLESNQSILIDEVHLTCDFISFYSKSANEYVNKEINTNRRWLFNALTYLLEFIQQNFDKWPYEQKAENFQICLHPTTNCDRGGNLTRECSEKHNSLTNEMLRKIRKTEKEYAQFRRSVKEFLYL
ncbi:MAG TPA: hypothetical protein VL098_09785 [Flavipsychrobacter sp.]|nr:hypothetical protein [Flavipsychrobacter sp.]